MSEDTTQQAVVDDAKTSAKPDAKAQDARDTDDLDALLAEYDEKPPPSSQPAAAEGKAGTDDLKALTDEVRGLLGEQQKQKFRQDMDATIKNIRGNLDPEFFDDAFVESWVDAEARKDPRLAQAWTNRHATPRQFKKVVETLGRSFEKKYGKLPDRGATEDREAVTAAVRGASTKAPEGKTPDFSGMSNAEYREAHKKQYGYYPSV